MSSWLCLHAYAENLSAKLPEEYLSTQIEAQTQSPTGDELLARMANAYRDLEYDLTLVFSNSQGLVTFRVIHEVNEGHHTERLIRMDGSYHELIKQDDQVVCITEGDANPGQFLPSKGFPSEMAMRLVNIQQNYNLKVSPELARVAGREVFQVALQPKDRYRYGHRFWVDKATGLLMKSTLVAGNRILRRVQVTKLAIGQDDMSALPKPSRPKSPTIAELPKRQTPVASAKRSVSVSGKGLRWHFRWLPRGFRPYEVNINSLDKGFRGRTFTDGLTSFSVFVEPSDDSYLKEGVIRMASTVSVSRRIRVKSDNRSSPNRPQQTNALIAKAQHATATHGPKANFAEPSPQALEKRDSLKPPQAFFVTVMGEVPESTVLRVAKELMVERIKDEN